MPIQFTDAKQKADYYSPYFDPKYRAFLPAPTDILEALYDHDAAHGCYGGSEFIELSSNARYTADRFWLPLRLYQFPMSDGRYPEAPVNIDQFDQNQRAITRDIGLDTKLFATSEYITKYCMDCSPGKYLDATTTNNKCVQCPTGYYNLDYGSSNCIECIGSFGDSPTKWSNESERRRSPFRTTLTMAEETDLTVNNLFTHMRDQFGGTLTNKFSCCANGTNLNWSTDIKNCTCYQGEYFSYGTAVYKTQPQKFTTAVTCERPPTAYFEVPSDEQDYCYCHKAYYRNCADEGGTCDCDGGYVRFVDQYASKWIVGSATISCTSGTAIEVDDGSKTFLDKVSGSLGHCMCFSPGDYKNPSKDEYAYNQYFNRGLDVYKTNDYMHIYDSQFVEKTYVGHCISCDSGYQMIRRGATNQWTGKDVNTPYIKNVPNIRIPVYLTEGSCYDLPLGRPIGSNAECEKAITELANKGAYLQNGSVTDIIITDNTHFCRIRREVVLWN